MGLTVHYSLKTKVRSTSRIEDLVESIQSIASEFPFKTVGPVVHQTQGFDHHFNSIRLPWSDPERPVSVSVLAVESFRFLLHPAPGTESSWVGFMRYPATVEAVWKPRDDRRFYKTRRYYDGQTRKAGTFRDFSWEKWNRFTKEKFDKTCVSETDPKFYEMRTIRTGLGGWSLSDFCKTAFASDERFGGVANFLSGHIGLVTFLDRISTLPSLEVEYEDEAYYGPATYCDDPCLPDGERVYYKHPGRYNIGDLMAQVGHRSTFDGFLRSGTIDKLHDVKFETDPGIQVKMASPCSFLKPLPGLDRLVPDPVTFTKMMARVAALTRTDNDDE